MNQAPTLPNPYANVFAVPAAAPAAPPATTQALAGSIDIPTSVAGPPPQAPTVGNSFAEPANAASQANTRKHDIATRAQIVALKAFGIPVPQISHYLGIQASTISKINKNAKTRGFDPKWSQESRRVLDVHVQDAPRSGRPRKATAEVEEEILNKLQENLSGQLSTTDISQMISVQLSSSTIHRLLNRIQKSKSAKKPNSTPKKKRSKNAKTPAVADSSNSATVS